MPSTRSSRRTVDAAVAIVILLLVGVSVAAVGAGAAVAAPNGVTANGVAAPTDAVALPPPSADPFYTYDEPLTGIAPGTVLRTRTVPYRFHRPETPLRATQVLYRTTDQFGAATATVATVLRSPVAGPPKLISYHMAYDALGSQCDPSYVLTGSGHPGEAATLEQGVISSYLAAGFGVVVPDYEGPALEWTIGRQSGYAALDGIRAAESVLRLPPSTPVGLAGYSGGSVPTQWGAEVAPRYAPGLNIVGAAAGGLPVNLAHNLPYVSGSKDWAGVIPALVVAYQRTYGFDTDAFLSARGQQIVHTVSAQCINAFADKYPGLTDGDMVRPPYRSLLDVAAVVRAINDNIMGSAGTPRAPMMLAVGDVDGTGDGVMITADVEGLAHQYCKRGVAVTYAQYGGLSHSEAFPPFQAQAAQFFAGRFAGAPPTNNCAAVGRGNSLAPAPVP